jgi:hypothetical protein
MQRSCLPLGARFLGASEELGCSALGPRSREEIQVIGPHRGSSPRGSTRSSAWQDFSPTSAALQDGAVLIYLRA